jgi:hypothetical protein
MNKLQVVEKERKVNLTSTMANIGQSISVKRKKEDRKNGSRLHLYFIKKSIKYNL